MLENERFVSAGEEYCDFDRRVPAPYMRGTFLLEKEAENAFITITALGFYDLYVNGARITKGILAPYISNPDQIVVYDRYDVKRYLRRGKNAVGLILGNGFSNGFGGFVWEFDKAPFRAAPKTAFAVEVNGEKIFSTENEIKTAPSPILFDELRQGEVYDARLEIKGWALPGFDDTEWRAAVAAPAPKGRFLPARFEPIAEHKRRRAVCVVPLEDGYLYDFGVNTAGVPVLKTDGKAGQKITLVCGEWFKNGDLELDNIRFAAQKQFKREAQTVEYICKGEAGEGFTPCFSYYGGRYVKVTGITPEQAVTGLVEFSEQSSAIRKIGSFTCSDEYANKTFENTVRSDFSNFFYFPTDCPHREKNGWTGDISLSSEQFSLLFDCGKSLAAWLVCLRAAQKENGAVPCIVPTGGWGYGWGSGPSWDGALTVLPYNLYRYTGDVSFLRDNADAIWKYLGFLKSIRKADNTVEYGLGDWCQIGAIRDSDYWTPVAVTDTLSALDICAKAEKIFGILGLADRAKEAAAMREEFRAAIRDNFVEWRYGDVPFCRPYCLTQTAQAMFIRYGIYTREELPHAVLRLKEIVGGADNRMQTGVFGVQSLLRVLCEHGMCDLAYDIAMNPEKPSFGALVAHGATSLWEFIHTFASGAGDDVSVGRIKSMNHHFWGDIAAWYITYLAGMRINEDLTDADRIDISPYFVSALSYVSASREMRSGEASAGWQRISENEIRLFVCLPRGAHGELKLHDGWRAASGESLRLSEGGNKFLLKRG